MRKITGLILFLQISIACFSQIDPVKDFGSLFDDVQKARIFKDQKKFPDCIPRFSSEVINRNYLKEKDRTDFDLKEFVAAHFDTLLLDNSGLLKHIDHLWSYLTKTMDSLRPQSSLLVLPKSYIVPGGRFREIYYWDSYFTMLGLQEARRYGLIEDMIDNFAYLIDKCGHIPNGNRTYYLSRSQPPFFSQMVQLLAEIRGDSIYLKYLPHLEKEYQFWMKGKENFSQDDSTVAFEHLVRIGPGKYLNRYWDASVSPRPESYLIDLKLKEMSQRDSSIYVDIRAAAESGWDFSSRWFSDGFNITSIQTTAILPVDLNCLLLQLEKTIATGYELKRDRSSSKKYKSLALQRKKLILEYFWDSGLEFYCDYNFQQENSTQHLSLAGLFPLYFKLEEDPVRIEAILSRIERDFLKDGGLVSTLVLTGQQWDAPNGWAPLQWIGYVACKNYADRYPLAEKLAGEIAFRWTRLNRKVFFETGKMLEKYNVVDIELPGGGGEYELQDGFGWTNGVYLKLFRELEGRE